MKTAEASEDVFIMLSADVQCLLAENSVSLSDILAQSSLSADEVREVPNPAPALQGAKEAGTLSLHPLPQSRRSPP